MIDNLYQSMLLCAWLNSSYEQMSGRSIGFHWLFPDTSAIFVFCWVTMLRSRKAGGSFEFGFRLVSAVRARLPGQLVRGTSRGSVEVSELSKCRNCRPRSLKFTRLSCRASKLATAWALESQVWAAKNHWTNFWFEFFKIFLFVRSEILSLLVLLYRIQWHAIATFFTRIFLAALRWCGEDVEGGTSVWFCGLCATTATCSGGGPKLTLHTENHLVCCVGTTFIGDIRQDFNHLYSPSIPHAFIHFSIWSWFR